MLFQIFGSKITKLTKYEIILIIDISLRKIMMDIIFEDDRNSFSIFYSMINKIFQLSNIKILPIIQYLLQAIIPI